MVLEHHLIANMEFNIGQIGPTYSYDFTPEEGADAERDARFWWGDEEPGMEWKRLDLG